MQPAFSVSALHISLRQLDDRKMSRSLIWQFHRPKPCRCPQSKSAASHSARPTGLCTWIRRGQYRTASPLADSDEPSSELETRHVGCQDVKDGAARLELLLPQSILQRWHGTMSDAPWAQALRPMLPTARGPTGRIMFLSAFPHTL